MRISEVIGLQEGTITATSLDGRKVIILRNPSPSVLIDRLKRTRSLRGIVVGKDVFWANSYSLIHVQIGRAIGAEDGYGDARLELKMKDGAPKLIIMAHNTSVQKIYSVPQVQRLQNAISDKPVVMEGEPSLRCALRDYDGKIYKGAQGETHLDVICRLPPEVKKKIGMDADTRGFVNNKGHFLDRFKAQDYANKHDLFHPTAPSWARSAQELTSEVLREGKTDAFFAEVVKTILSVVPDALEIWFHGSRATGENKKNSDWDFLVVVASKERRIELSYAGTSLVSINRVAGKLVDIQPADEEDFSHSGSAAYWAKEEGRCIWRRSSS